VSDPRVHETDQSALPIAAAEELVSDRLRLTPLTVDDASEMHPVLADPELYVFTGESVPSLEQLERRYTVQCAGPPEPDVAWRNWIFRLSEDGRAVGFVQATVTGDEAIIAWLVGVAWQRQGIATEAATVMCTRLTNQGIERLVAHIHPGHHASARIAHALGMHPTAELDAEGERVWIGTP
jgi:RimJ/RimL family protein N-acetyltransferase